MPQKKVGNEFRTTLVCVDEYGPDRFRGRLCNAFLDGAQPFDSLMQMLLKMDALLDEMQLPQSFSAKRAFAPALDTRLGTPTAEVQEGKLATFAVRVLFRQNASWQGSVAWVKTGREESFRSVLELAFLIDSALSGNAAARPVS